MAEKNLVNETLIQIQNLEEVINENAKEILASTMKEEIGELVKESLKEGAKMETQEAEEEEFDVEDFETDEESEEESEEEETDSEEDEMGDEDIMGMDDEESEEEESEDEDMFDMDDEDMMDMDSEVADLSGETDFEKVFKVFKNMKNSDTVTVIPDGDYTKISDEDEDVEYLIQAESETDEMAVKAKGEPELGEEEEYELEETDELEEGDSEIVYEIEVDSEYELEEESDPDELYSEEWNEEDENNESYNMMEAKKAKKMETKEGMKPKVGKGASLGSANKFSYKKSSGGFKETMKKANPLKGTGKPKFEFKEGEEMEMKPKKKGETKEAARTYGTGWRKGALRKGARAGQESARKETNESVMVELEMLRAKNEEYRKALNLFRDKLNEVAIFNSNLAYATRLFTEHSTSKQEKINILRRFDTAETLKESKALYKTIKDELSQVTKVTPITESIERVIEREPQSGSAINLIESKTYENPQFLRMKDIMSKIAK